MNDSKQQDGGRLFDKSEHRMIAEILTPKKGNVRARIRLRYHGINLGVFSGEVNECKAK